MSFIRSCFKDYTVCLKCAKRCFSPLKVGKFEVDFEDEDEDDWGTSNGCRIMGIMYENDMVTFALILIKIFITFLSLFC